MSDPTAIHILAVDDRPANLLVLEVLLEPLGVELVRASTGEEALTVAASREFALVLLDLFLPGIDGIETARRLRAREATRDVPIIFLTAFDRVDEQMEQAYALGAVDFLVKPIVPPMLLAKVSVFTELHKKNKAIIVQEHLLREAQTREHQLSLEREREQALQKAQRLESLGHLAAGIAHDFNNMLSVIMASSSLVNRDLENTEKARELLGEIENACERATGLTRQLLTFARGGAPVRKLSDVDAVIRDSIGFSLRGSGTANRFEIERPLWPAEIDVGQITQVLSNLALNARDAMNDAGELVVRARNVTLDVGGLPAEPGNYVEISVEDHGAGIAPKHLERIFDLYFSTKPGHHGLGLASAYSVVRRHDGHMRVESNAGQGTTFFVYLRAVPQAQLEEPAPVSEMYAGGGHVLVMDDEPQLRELLEESLSALGCRAEGAAHGADAVELYRAALERNDPFDIVILDLTVRGGKGGAETLRELVALDAGVVAIACSGYANDPVMCDHATYGFSDVLSKPFRFAMLARVVRRQMAASPHLRARQAV